MEIINGQPHLTMKEAGERFVDLHRNIDLRHATDIVSQRLRAMNGVIKQGARVFAPESTVTAVIQKPPRKTPTKQPVVKRIGPKETNEQNNEETVHVAYCAGYVQRFIDEYAVGIGLPTQTLTAGVSRLLSGQKSR